MRDHNTFSFCNTLIKGYAQHSIIAGDDNNLFLRHIYIECSNNTQLVGNIARILDIWLMKPGLCSFAVGYGIFDTEVICRHDLIQGIVKTFDVSFKNFPISAFMLESIL